MTKKMLVHSDAPRTRKVPREHSLEIEVGCQETHTSLLRCSGARVNAMNDADVDMSEEI